MGQCLLSNPDLLRGREDRYLQHKRSKLMLSPEVTSKKIQILFYFSIDVPLQRMTIKVIQSGKRKDEVLAKFSPILYHTIDNERYVSIKQTISVTFQFERSQFLYLILTDKETQQLHSKSQICSINEIYRKSKIFQNSPFNPELIDKKFLTKNLLKEGEVKGKILITFDQTTSQNIEYKLQFRSRQILSERIMFCLCSDSIYFRLQTSKGKIVSQNQSAVSPKNHLHDQIIFIQKKQVEQFSLIFFNCKSHKYIGQTSFKILQLKNEQREFNIYDKQATVKGNLLIEKFQYRKIYTLEDYLRKGMEFSCKVAIDFTDSNNDHSQKTSLHFFDQENESQYEKAMTNILDILIKETQNRFLSVYGFGAKVKMNECNSQNFVSNLFPLNGDLHNPQVYQLLGITEAYRNAIPYLTFSGPSRLAPLLSKFIQEAEIMKSQKKYLLLLIFTDGQIYDYKEVLDKLVECGRLPISIIIVGLTNQLNYDWSPIKQLDDPKCTIKNSNNKNSERNVVKFIEYKQYESNTKEMINKVMKDLQNQIVQYHSLMNIIPEDYIKPQGFNKFSEEQQLKKTQKINKTNKIDKISQPPISIDQIKIQEG